MLKAEEVASFLEKAQRISSEWSAQVQFMRDEFIPQMENLNNNISERSHVPEVSRNILNGFMIKSAEIGYYNSRSWPATGGNYSQGHTFSAMVHETVDHSALTQLFFPNDALLKSLGTQHDFALYFDNNYKEILIGLKSPTAIWYAHDPARARIYTNYDFYLDVAVINFSESSFNHNGYRSEHVLNAVPLSGQYIKRENFQLTFQSLGSPATSVTDPSPAQLATFLTKRKPYIHPVVVLDYIRTQPLPVISAFFTDVSQYDLARAKDGMNLRGAELSAHAAENFALKKALQAEADRVREMKEAHVAQEELLKQQRIKMNAAALRIKKLEIKLKQSEQMYEDLQMRLIDEEGLDDVDIDDLELGDDDDLGTVGTEPTRAL